MGGKKYLTWATVCSPRGMSSDLTATLCTTDVESASKTILVKRMKFYNSKNKMKKDSDNKFQNREILNYILHYLWNNYYSFIYNIHINKK